MSINYNHETKDYRQYVWICSASILFMATVCFIINLMADPLWYWKGNQLTHKNFAFNERISKINLFLQDPDKYDCFIFGSSRTTLLNQHDIEGYTCFNFSFSGGNVFEIIEYSEYLKSLKYYPKLVILGIDGFNFTLKKSINNVPDFVLTRRRPPNILKSYLSFDSLKFSKRSFMEESNLPRYYKEDFTVDILKNSPKYHPEHEKPKKLEEREGSYTLDNLTYYEQLTQVFPNAQYIGYVPPISYWKILELQNTNELNIYLEAIHRISGFIQPLYDFSIPSDITKNTDNTYDGSHYNVYVNKLITRIFNSKTMNFGLQVDKMNVTTYKNKYANMLQHHK